MQYRGRFISIGVVGLFNVIRYFYYHQYYDMPFEASFFILTAVFLLVAWWGGKQFDRAKYYSEKDPLTKIYNRRAVENFFQKHAKKNPEKDYKLGVIMLDLDNFKAINDSYGHHKGDQLIAHIASILNGFAKKDDIVARWGGDEFLILVPNISENFKSDYVHSLHEELEKHDVENYPSVGVSVGVAIYPTDGKSFCELIQIADRAMYKDKGIKLEVS